MNIWIARAKALGEELGDLWREYRRGDDMAVAGVRIVVGLAVTWGGLVLALGLSGFFIGGGMIMILAGAARTRT